MTPLSVLLVEDSDSDAELILRGLTKAEFEVSYERVETADEMARALASPRWDIIISDYNLPGFSASAALALMHAAGLDLPFIVVSNNIGEETAVSLMRASEERWNFALEGAGYGVWDWDIASGTVMFSDCWKTIHGYQDGEVPTTVEGRDSLIHPDDVDRVRAALQEYFSGSMARYTNEYRSRCRDGSWKWVLDNGMIVSRDAQGRPLRMICTHVDLSERKRAEEALRELNEQLENRVEERTRELRQAMAQIIESEKLASLGVLVAGVSHELNTPIGNMVLVATSLLDKLGEVMGSAGHNTLTRSGLQQALSECHGAAEIIARNGYRASDLIESFKRVSVDQTSQRRRRFDLRGTVQDSLTALGAVTRRAKARVDLQIPAGIEMDSYPGHLEQIINNVIMNSITHGFDGRDEGHIVIAASCHAGTIELVYSDDGRGIAPELQHKVFEPFYTTKLGQGGSGLGLSIVHNLVQAIFKGQLRLESAPDQGVKLVFSFPSVTPHTAGDADGPDPDLPPPACC